MELLTFWGVIKKKLSDQKYKSYDKIAPRYESIQILFIVDDLPE